MGLMLNVMKTYPTRKDLTTKVQQSNGRRNNQVDIWRFFPAKRNSTCIKVTYIG